MAIKLQAGSSKTGVAISERHRNPAEIVAVAPKANYLVAGICAIVAALIFSVMLAILYMDWTALSPA